jgi:hypothetical protein
MPPIAICTHAQSWLLAQKEWKYLQNYADAKTVVIEEIIARVRGSEMKTINVAEILQNGAIKEVADSVFGPAVGKTRAVINAFTAYCA